MALTLEAQQRLEKVGLSAFYKKKKAPWQTMAKKTYDFVADNFPDGAPIRLDDVAKAFVPVLEVTPTLIDMLSKKKLKQKYWISDFADLILDDVQNRDWWK